ncbi:MAG TPA: hypothetical protein PLB25_02250, partial [Rhodoferax sp.]|nr:hypothetical protein [Rhodoferax sp.]
SRAQSIRISFNPLVATACQRRFSPTGFILRGGRCASSISVVGRKIDAIRWASQAQFFASHRQKSR